MFSENYTILDETFSKIYHVFWNILRIKRKFKISLNIYLWAGHVARTEEGRFVFRVLVEKNPKAKRPLERPRSWWEYNIKMDL